jgi:hypothetical protein
VLKVSPVCYWIQSKLLILFCLPNGGSTWLEYKGSTSSKLCCKARYGTLCCNSSVLFIVVCWIHRGEQRYVWKLAKSSVVCNILGSFELTRWYLALCLVPARTDVVYTTCWPSHVHTTLPPGIAFRKVCFTGVFCLIVGSAINMKVVLESNLKPAIHSKDSNQGTEPNFYVSYGCIDQDVAILPRR